jgi:hypothetical protein
MSSSIWRLPRRRRTACYRLLESIREVMRDSMEEGLVRNLNRADWEFIQSTQVQLVRLTDKQDAPGAGTCMASHFDKHIEEILTLQSRSVRRPSRPRLSKRAR